MRSEKGLKRIRRSMDRCSLAKAVVLGLSLSVTLGTAVQAQVILQPGDYASDSPITLTTSDTAIGTSGTYTITNSSKTLTINSPGNYHAIALHDGGTSTITGNVVLNMNNLPSEYYNWNHAIVDSNTKLTLNGDLTVTSDSPNTVFATTGRLSHASRGSELDINGNVKIDVTSYSKNGIHGSQTAFIADDATINVNGDVCDIESRFKNDTPSSGANTVYASGDGIVNINSTKTIIKSSGGKPDAISAKGWSSGTKAAVNINSKTTQVVGDIDFLDRGHGGTVNAVFDGNTSFWYGDMLDNVPNTFFFGGTEGKLNVTFKNGATYIPFGQFSINKYFADKYVSAITLEKGGIVNLYDANAQQKWADEGLLEAFPALKNTKLDYILLGDLKGSGGTFCLDMNSTDKAKTDMIYVLNNTGTSGVHNIQAYSADSLANVSAKNTLRFATVAAAAANKVAFQDEMNMYGKSLWDYKLKIGHSAYDLNDPENSVYNDSRNIYGASIDDLMNGGMNWFIYDYAKTPVPSVINSEVAGDAAYGMWRYDDTLRKRLGDMRYMDGQKDGIWIRYRTNKTTADAFNGSNQMYQLGYDKRDGHTIYGVAIDETQGSNTFRNGNGDDSMTNLSLYATNYRKGGVYSDIVARIGKVRANMYSHGSYDDYADFNAWGYTLSYEASKTCTHGNGWFVEPEAQLAVGRLNGSTSTSNHGFTISRDAATSILGRLGVVLGRKASPRPDYYVKANLYHEFSNSGAMDFYYGTDALHYDGNHRDTWYEAGLGGNVKIHENNYFYCDILKTFGADIQKKWQLNTGLRWAW